jgi:hypothetical protein
MGFEPLRQVMATNHPPLPADPSEANVWRATGHDGQRVALKSDVDDGQPRVVSDLRVVLSICLTDVSPATIPS